MNKGEIKESVMELKDLKAYILRSGAEKYLGERRLEQVKSIDELVLAYEKLPEYINYLEQKQTHY